MICVLIHIIVFIHRAQIYVQGNYSHVERGINQLLKEICFGDNIQGERMIGFLLLLAYMYNLWSANDFCLISFFTGDAATLVLCPVEEWIWLEVGTFWLIHKCLDVVHLSNFHFEITGIYVL